MCRILLFGSQRCGVRSVWASHGTRTLINALACTDCPTKQTSTTSTRRQQQLLKTPGGKHHSYTTSATTDNTTSNDFNLVYEGPLSSQIRRLKWVSLTTATIALLFAPASIYLSRDGTPTVGKIVVVGTVGVWGVTTTFLLHWMSRVYVHRLYFDAGARNFRAETFNLLGMRTKWDFHVGEVEIPEVESSFSTFVANGRKFFLHQETKEAQQVLNYVREYNYERDVLQHSGRPGE